MPIRAAVALNRCIAEGKAVVAIDAHTMQVTNSLPVQGDPLRVYPVGQDQLLVTDLETKSVTLYGTDFRTIWTTALSGQPSGATLHPTAPIAYVSLLHENRVDVLDLNRGTVEGSFTTGAQPDSAVVLPA
ncbi:YncE family protein [Nocardia sp. NPDC051570]|uniref:YncE family protein n=1 Tax=Nocardia sp. NPDC051570 TaxID=3364324 RepID=UPI0037A0EA2F